MAEQIRPGPEGWTRGRKIDRGVEQPVLWSAGSAREIVMLIRADAEDGLLALEEAMDLIDRVWARAGPVPDGGVRFDREQVCTVTNLPATHSGITVGERLSASGR